MRILVTGASGAGTSTLGRALAARRGAAYFEADDFFWVPTDPPCQVRRRLDVRLAMAFKALNSHPETVVAGSVMGWDDTLESSFTHIIFVRTPTRLRLQRIQQREMARCGRVDAGFLRWAAQYDNGPPEGRSLAGHIAWLETRKCPVIRSMGAESIEAQLNAIEGAISSS